MITNNNTNKDQDNEVYILGTETSEKTKGTTNKTKWIVFSACAVLAILVGIILIFKTTGESTPEYYFEPEHSLQESISIITDTTSVGAKGKGYIEALNDTINDVPLAIYVPHNSTMSLCIGMPEQSDSSIVFAAMAADIRKDNQQIVGDFVLSGKRLARGIAKKGFCAIDGQTISIGVSEYTPLLDRVIENGGSFFRQYPLVHNGILIENRIKNKSIRRALAVRDEQVIMVESRNVESFHDFSQALIDIGVSDAIYLVGGNAYGWYYDHAHVRNEFGEELTDLPENISYIVWRSK